MLEINDIVLYCIVLYCIVLYCIVLYCNMAPSVVHCQSSHWFTNMGHVLLHSSYSVRLDTYVNFPFVS